jgi:SAM-dependent methyltransferase
MTLVRATAGLFILFLCSLIVSCGILKKNKPYDYGWVPKNYSEVEKHHENISQLLGCSSGETIASIGAGNGKFEIAVSCFVPGIHWYLQEIDSPRLYEFDQVKAYFEKLKGSAIEADFHLVLGTDEKTNLPYDTFDRVLMINVFHELEDPEPIMYEILKLMNKDGRLVIMERMARSRGQKHNDCHFPKLYEPDFLATMSAYGYHLESINLGEDVSNLKFYIFSGEAP